MGLGGMGGWERMEDGGWDGRNGWVGMGWNGMGEDGVARGRLG